MLFKETVSAELLGLTQQVLACEALNNFCLVGGTALSLQLGHRKSIDIDLFSTHSFDAVLLNELLSKEFQFKNTNMLKNGLFGSINSIKIDLLSHQYKLLSEPIIEDGIRMLHAKDIVAMKLNAIIGNGSRLKDFVDIAFLSSQFSLEEMIGFFEQKYPNSNPLMAVKSINWFDEIDFSTDIVYLKRQIPWAEIKTRITQMVLEPSVRFAEFG